MTKYKIAGTESSTFYIAESDTATIDAGASIIDPSVNDNSAIGLANANGIGDLSGGGNKVEDYGTVEGFVGMWFGEGDNHVAVGTGGLSYGSNAGVEFHDGGNNFLVVRTGGEVGSEAYGVWTGAIPSADPESEPDSGSNTISNFGTIYADRDYGIRMALGG